MPYRATRRSESASPILSLLLDPKGTVLGLSELLLYAVANVFPGCSHQMPENKRVGCPIFCMEVSAL
jgi:hypothetical protein